MSDLEDRLIAEGLCPVCAEMGHNGCATEYAAELRSRLAAVEAERDLAQRRVDALLSRAETAEQSEALMIEHRVELNDALHEVRAHVETAEARLAAVEALCDDEIRDGRFDTSFPNEVRAAARGEGNRPAEPIHMGWMSLAPATQDAITAAANCPCRTHPCECSGEGDQPADTGRPT